MLYMGIFLYICRQLLTLKGLVYDVEQIRTYK